MGCRRMGTASRQPSGSRPVSACRSSHLARKVQFWSVRLRQCKHPSQIPPPKANQQLQLGLRSFLGGTWTWNCSCSMLGSCGGAELTLGPWQRSCPGGERGGVPTTSRALADSSRHVAPSPCRHHFHIRASSPTSPPPNPLWISDQCILNPVIENYPLLASQPGDIQS